MGNTAFTGRQVGEGADVLEAMARDKECFVVMTLAGAMTVAKQGLIVTELIDRGIVKAIISTGALMAHGLVEAAGRSHFKLRPEDGRSWSCTRPATTASMTRWSRRRISTSWRPSSPRILKSWDHNEVHLLVQAESRDWPLPEREREGARHSEVGVREECAGICAGLQRFGDRSRRRAAQSLRAARTGMPPLRFDPFEDLEYYAETLLQQERLGIFTIGGGVPRNWAQQFGPVHRAAPSPRRGRPAAEALPLRRAHLPRAGELGRPLRLHLQRSRVVGQVRSCRKKAASSPKCCWMRRWGCR